LHQALQKLRRADDERSIGGRFFTLGLFALDFEKSRDTRDNRLPQRALLGPNPTL